MDTIVALATARGRAGVAVVRVSGVLAWEVCAQIVGRVPPVRKATLARLHSEDGEFIDEGVVIVFEEGHSFTGEAVCEFQVHGSVAVVGALLRACLAIDGVRAAEAGEFTRRAFFSGRLDLVQVEALADLIDAETEAQRRQAQSVLDGSARKVIDGWRDDLIEALSILEASLDFVDEELPDDLNALILAPLERVHRTLTEQISGRRAAETLREGFEVAIIGKVNAGKSSLLNCLAGREAAITSERAGTTRDVIEVRLEIGGLPVTLIDTAGLREAEDEIEEIGIARGQKRAEDADLRVYLKGSPTDIPVGVREDDIVVLSKCDLWGKEGISSTTKAGIDDLVGRIEAILSRRIKGSSVFSRERHFSQLANADAYLLRARKGLEAGQSWELVAEDVRLARRCLDGILGRIDVEDVLGRIFSSFCIGK